MRISNSFIKKLTNISTVIPKRNVVYTHKVWKFNKKNIWTEAREQAIQWPGYNLAQL